MIFTLILLGLCWGIDGKIQQMFPTNQSFSCPAGPSFRWNCTFPMGAITVFWASPGIASIPNDYLGHRIDNSLIQSGVSILEVNRSSDAKESYRCIAVFPNTSQESSQMRPEIANMRMACFFKIFGSSVQVNWTNMYPDCFKNFSVFVNGIENGTTAGDNYTITVHRMEAPYNICVVAWDNGGNTQSDWIDCADITLREPGCSNCIPDVMLRVVISVVGVCLVLVILGAVGLIPSILCCCSKAGKKPGVDSSSTERGVSSDVNRSNINNGPPAKPDTYGQYRDSS